MNGVYIVTFISMVLHEIFITTRKPVKQTIIVCNGGTKEDNFIWAYHAETNLSFGAMPVFQ